MSEMVIKERADMMASGKYVFGVAGPLHLTSVNWKCSHHRRSVAACLIEGAYISERDRQSGRKGHEALAPPWWEFFHFELTSTLIDDADSSIFGAIYEFKPPASSRDSSVQDAPKFVIAFRGTLLTKYTWARDVSLDLEIMINRLHQTSRFQIAMQAVQNVVSDAKSPNIWLAGHSSGAAIAMLAGKNMAKTGTLLETFLFNPPFVSAPIERIGDKNVKRGIRIAGSLITVGLSVASKDRHEKPAAEDPFSSLSSWVPHLFVNPRDLICSGYIGYFEHRKFMERVGLGCIEKLATQNSLVGLILGKDSDALHLLPSANLTINLIPSTDFKIDHGIRQWWRADLQLQSEQYHYG